MESTPDVKHTPQQEEPAGNALTFRSPLVAHNLRANRPTLVNANAEAFKDRGDSSTKGVFGEAVNRRIEPVYRIKAHPGHILPLAGWKFLPFQEKPQPKHLWGHLPLVVEYSVARGEYVFKESSRWVDAAHKDLTYLKPAHSPRISAGIMREPIPRTKASPRSPPRPHRLYPHAQNSESLSSEGVEEAQYIEHSVRDPPFQSGGPISARRRSQLTRELERNTEEESFLPELSDPIEGEFLEALVAWARAKVSSG